MTTEGEGKFVVVWESATQDGDFTGVFAQRFGPACDVEPQQGCQPSASGKGKISLKQAAAHDKDVLSWKWTSSALVSKADFGAPLTASNYTLCVYDGAQVLQFDVGAPAGTTCAGKACWKESPHGFKYADKARASDGLQKIGLKEGGAGKAKLGVKGRGLLLGLPSLQMTVPVTAQLKRSDGSECWETTFSAPQANSSGTFKGKSD